MDLGVLILGCIFFFFGYKYGGCIWDDEEQGGSGVDGRYEAAASDEVDCAGCHGRSFGNGSRRFAIFLKKTNYLVQITGFIRGTRFRS